MGLYDSLRKSWIILMPMTRGPDHVIAIGFLKAHAIPVALSMVEHGSDPSMWIYIYPQVIKHGVLQNPLWTIECVYIQYKYNIII